MSVVSSSLRISPRSLWLMYVLSLVSSALLAWRFVWVVVTGVFNVAADQSGHAIFFSTSQSKPFYPFTLAATALSFVGVSYYVYRAECGRWWSLPLALLVGLVSTVGMVNLYEQVFINFADSVWKTNYWWYYYGNSLGAFLTMLVGVSWVFGAVSWWRSENKRPAVRFFAVYLLSMLVWLVLGMPGVESGSIVSYSLNTISRFFSQATLIVLIAKPLPFAGNLRKLHLA